VIAHDDDDRILREAARAKRLHESTEVVVDIGDRAQIGAARVAHLSLGDRLRVHRADVAQAARVGIERLGGARGHGDVLVEIEVPIALRHGERIVRVGERSHEQEGPPVIRASNVEDRPLRSEGDLVVEVELVGAHAHAGLSDRAHIVVPARPGLGMVPVGRPAVVGRIDVGGQPLFEAVQLVRAAEVHFSRQDCAVAAQPQMMGESRDIGREFRGVVIDAGARGQEPRHERGARGRTERACAIGAVEDDAAFRERLHVGRMGWRMAVDRQERRRHLVGHDDEDVQGSACHRFVPFGLADGFPPGLACAAGSGFSGARARAHSFSTRGRSAGG